MFERRVLRKIFAQKREEVPGEWRRLHNKELYHPFSSPNVIRVIKSRQNEMGGAYVTFVGGGGLRGACRVVGGKPGG